ncbi:hypothetical protein L1049_009553 [Liquidambar formosana]|uniref:Leucine-rich repeat-containing N-terminal plant-type domain-containing protein n=1 Tax=Liquidambar formosana TaxID=63359 RepID=A0AAP0R3K5_LIQFO
MDRSSIFISISRFLFLLLLWLFGLSCLQIIKPTSCTGSNLTAKCTETERKALLIFKDGLIDPSGRLSSWVGDDCCNWGGLGCSKRTGHVLKLDLRNPFHFSTTNDSENTAYNMSCLGGEINASLLSLKYLNYLDLSLNDFSGKQIPEFLGSFKNLRYLDLSFSSFSGVIPPHLGNLSSLRYLDVSAKLSYSNQPNLEVESLQWLVRLSSLKHLSLSSVNLERANFHWLQAVNMLPSLVELHLPNCGLTSLPLSISYINFTSLSVLDLSYNNFNSSIPHWLSNVTGLTKLDLSMSSLRGVMPDIFVNLVSLQELDFTFNVYIEGQLPDSLGHLRNLSRLDLAATSFTGRIPRTFGNLCNLQTLNLMGNKISGEINEFMDGLSRCSNNSLEYLVLGTQLSGNLPESLGELKKLTYLDLTANLFWGSIPASIGSLSSLQVLALSQNAMNGTIPESIGQLSMLVFLSLGTNSWQGVLTEAHFRNHTKLQHLDLSLAFGTTTKPLVLDVKHDWLPPFSLQEARLSNVQIGPTFPPWLQTQYELEYLSLDSAGISDTIPIGFWKSCSKITYLSLPDNKLKGMVPKFLGFPKAFYIDLSFNNLEGPFPLLPSNVSVLYLDHNSFFGPIPKNIGQFQKFYRLDLSSNSINGTIPPSIHKLKNMEVLSLKNNLLSGELPKHWENFQSLRVLDVANNSLSGKVPISIGSLSSLRLLSLSNNNLEGELPSSLRNCTTLISLDLGENKFFGNLPAWIGESMSSCLMFRARSNFFNGNIPQELCLLSNLQFLDLAHNDFSGVIPQCLGNLSKVIPHVSDSYSIYQHMLVVSKGRELQYDRTLYLVHSLDLSGNNLSGEIPEDITSLLGLGIMNLSMNHLTGNIPAKIGNLRMLETLDLSRNQLSGPIPESLSSLSFLSHLNLSHNNLSGRMPSGNQLQTLNDSSSIYADNPLLCGSPLDTKCPGEDTNHGPTSTDGNGLHKDGEKGSEFPQFYIAMVPGFIVGFWGVCGTLVLKASWRQAYFRFFDSMKDWLVVVIMVNVNRFKRKFKSEDN